MKSSEIDVRRVDYKDPVQGRDLVTLLNAYAQDPLGGGSPLARDVQDILPQRLASFPGAYSFIAYQAGLPIGLLNAFTGFSTFSASPLINIHDVYVAPDARGSGTVDALFKAIESVAEELHCCKLTLEVLEENGPARSAYNRLGYKGYDLGEAGGEALFWQKKLA